jgi:flagellar motor switch protein FliN/FliY
LYWPLVTSEAAVLIRCGEAAGGLWESKDERNLIDGFVAELAAVINAMLGAAITPKATNGKGKAAKAADPWVVRVSATGASSKVLAVAFSRAAAGKLSARVMMMDSDPADAEIADTLKELVQQAIGSLSLKPIAKGIEFTVQTEVEAATSPLAGATGFDLPVDGDLNVQIACVMEEGEAIDEPAASSAADPFTAASSRILKDVPENLDVILDIDLPLSVRFGHAELTLDALTKLGPGSLIELARLPDDPVELLVNGKLVARGEVVVVGGNYGVRVHEVVSAEARIRTLE